MVSNPSPAWAAFRGRFMAWVVIGCCCLGLSGCAATVPAPLQASEALSDTGATRLGRTAAATLHSLGPGSSPDLSAVHLLPQGLEALEARRALIERAERSLDIQYYIWRPDTSGAGLATALWHAAERGVRVRLLLDDWGARPAEDELGLLAAHPNIEVRLFNPLGLRWSLPLALLLDFDRGNRRMHNKLLVADNQVLIAGGRNVGDEYFDRRSELQFGDLDILAMGPVVRQASDGFDRFWNHPEVRLVRPETHRDQAHAADPVAELWAATRATGWADAFDQQRLAFFAVRATALQDEPVKVQPAPGGHSGDAGHLGRQIAAVMGGVQSELLLVSPYFVPGDGGVAQLRALRDAGVRVRVVTNSLAATDVPAVHAGYGKYRRPLLEAGIELFEIRADVAPSRQAGFIRTIGSSRLSLHAKLIVVDRRTAFIGSMNIDPRSLRLNTENGVVLDSRPLAESLSSGIDRQLSESAYRVELWEDGLRWTSLAPGGVEVHHHTEPQAGWWLRLQTRLMRCLPIEGLL
ncbi:MAG: phospholipase D family protein [Burkholderiales bacterium]|nr:MAG: phospholipase D family protein [Burkholderiales bacterium]